MLAGAVYTAVAPLVERLPTAGFSVQVTPVLLVPETVALNDWVCEGVTATVVGVMEILTGSVSDTVALADLVISAALVAVAVTV